MKTLGPGLGLGDAHSGAFTFQALSACLLACMSEKVVLASGDVSQWTDQSGNGFHLVQTTGSARPSYNASDASYGGYPSLSFVEGSSQFLAAASDVTGAQPFTFYFVGECDTDSTYETLLTAGVSAGIYSGGGDVGYYAGSVQTTAHSATSPMIVAAVFDGASSALYVNASSTPTSTGNPGAQGLTGYAFQIGNAGFGAFYTGKAVALGAYSVGHTATQIKQVVKGLSAKYGIAVT